MTFTAQGLNWPTIVQFSIFLPNRVGALQQLLRLFQGERIHILGISVVNLVDCAVIRLVFSTPEKARQILRDADYPLNETSLLGVEIGGRPGQPTLEVCATLLQREISIDYVYPMFRSIRHSAVLALHVDDIGTAAEVLQAKGFVLLSEGDLEREDLVD